MFRVCPGGHHMPQIQLDTILVIIQALSLYIYVYVYIYIYIVVLISNKLEAREARQQLPDSSDVCPSRIARHVSIPRCMLHVNLSGGLFGGVLQWSLFYDSGCLQSSLRSPCEGKERKSIFGMMTLGLSYTCVCVCMLLGFGDCCSPDPLH